MNPISHAAISGVTGVAFFYFTRSWPGAITCLTAGVFLDIDHVFDFVAHKKRLPVGYEDLDSFCGKERQGKIRIFFHSYELWAVFWLLAFFFKFDHFWIGLGLGATTHMLSDHLVNPVRPMLYFLFYRIKHKFHKKYVFPDDYYKALK